jgi:hypothetical protein
MLPIAHEGYEMLTLLSNTVEGATDVVEAIRQVLRASEEPMTPARIQAALARRGRCLSLETLADILERQVAAQVLVPFPKYRSRHDRYWDRSLRLHVEQLARRCLRDGPLTRAALRRRLPGYARILADSALDHLLAHGRIHEHPSPDGRTGRRLALYPADPRAQVRPELAALFRRMQRLGYRRTQVRDAALAILREEAWDEPRRAPVRSSIGPRFAAVPRQEALTSV